MKKLSPIPRSKEGTFEEYNGLKKSHRSGDSTTSPLSSDYEESSGPMEEKKKRKGKSNVSQDDSMGVNTIQENSCSIEITTTSTYTSTEKTSSNKIVTEVSLSVPSESEDDENKDLTLIIDDSRLEKIFMNLVEIVSDSKYHFNTENIHELHHTIYRHISNERDNTDKSNLLKKIEEVVKTASKKHKAKKREV